MNLNFKFIPGPQFEQRKKEAQAILAREIIKMYEKEQQQLQQMKANQN